MSLVSVRNGLVTTLAACGPYLAKEISTCDFGIIAVSAGSAIIITPTGDSNIELATMGGNAVALNEYPVWEITGEVYVAYRGDSPTFLSKIWSGIDDIRTTVGKDVTLAGQASFARITKFHFNINEAYDISGIDYGVFRFQLEAYDYT